MKKKKIIPPFPVKKNYKFDAEGALEIAERMRENMTYEEKQKFIKDNWDLFLGMYYHQPCAGCVDGHSSMWKTMIESKEWAAWQKEQRERFKLLREKKLDNGLLCWDMAECEEVGIISPRHWKDFMEFLFKQNVSR